MAFHLVGVDLGGTKIATAMTDTDSTILNQETVPVPVGSPPEVVIAEMIASIRRVTAGERPESLLGVGVAIAGMVEPETGRVLMSPNLNWRDVPLGSRLAETFDLPIYVANDVSMAALGENYYGASRGYQHVLTVWVGTGIGSGLILNGQLYRGATGIAGELGQTTVAWNGPPCPGGNQGCLEQYAADPAMRRRALEAIAAGRPTTLKGPYEALSVEALAAAAEQGDALAVEVIDEAGEILGAGLTNAINLLNPEVVVLGGGVIRSVPRMLVQARAAVGRRTLPIGPPCAILPSQLGRQAAVIGATVFAKLAGQPTAARR